MEIAENTNDSPFSAFDSDLTANRILIFHNICSNIIDNIKDLYEKDLRKRSEQKITMPPVESEIQCFKDLEIKHHEIVEELKAIDFMKIIDTMEPA